MENNPLQPLPEPQASDLKSELTNVYHLLLSTLVLLILITGAFCLFMLFQVRTLSFDIQNTRVAWTNAMAQYQNNAPIMEDVTRKFQEFARSNSDFASILTRYGITPGAPVAPMPGAPVKKK